MTPTLALAGSAQSFRKPLPARPEAAVADWAWGCGEYEEEPWHGLASERAARFAAAPALVDYLQRAANQNAPEEFHAGSAMDLLAGWLFSAKDIRPKEVFRACDLERQAVSEHAYSDEDLESMAKEDPVALATLMLDSKMSPWEATFGAEYLGRHCAGTSFADLAVDALIQLLSRDPSALREGAVYGLRYLSSERADSALTARLAVETVEGVRAAIAESLGW